VPQMATEVGAPKKRDIITARLKSYRLEEPGENSDRQRPHGPDARVLVVIRRPYAVYVVHEPGFS